MAFEILTTGEAAKMLGCSIQYVIRACDKGIIPSYRLPGSKFRRIIKADLLKVMHEHGVPERHDEPTTINAGDVA